MSKGYEYGTPIEEHVCEFSWKFHQTTKISKWARIIWAHKLEFRCVCKGRTGRYSVSNMCQRLWYQCWYCNSGPCYEVQSVEGAVYMDLQQWYVFVRTRKIHRKEMNLVLFQHLLLWSQPGEVLLMSMYHHHNSLLQSAVIKYCLLQWKFSQW